MGIDKFFEKFGLSKPEPEEDEAAIEAPPAEPAKKPAEPGEMAVTGNAWHSIRVKTFRNSKNSWKESP